MAPRGRTYSNSRIVPPDFTTRPISAQSRDLLILRQNTEQKGGNCSVKGLILKLKVGYIHLKQLNLNAERKASTLGPCQHGWADIDADDFGFRWVKLDVTTCSDPRIQYPPREALEEQGPYRAIAAILKGEIEQVIEWRNAFVSVQIG
jgi:hypothetical protein